MSRAMLLDDPLSQRDPTPDAKAKPGAKKSKTAGAGEPSAPTAPAPRTPEAIPAEEPTPTASAAPDDPWRAWDTGGVRAQTYKLPDRLIEELNSRTTSLRLPIGMTVAASILAALDLGDDDLTRLVERAEEARERGRRAARRAS